MGLCEQCEQLLNAPKSDPVALDTRRMTRAGAAIRSIELTGIPMSCSDCGASWVRWACYTVDLRETWEYKPSPTDVLTLVSQPFSATLEPDFSAGRMG